jgi:hypothetical protein
VRGEDESAVIDDDFGSTSEEALLLPVEMEPPECDRESRHCLLTRL